jgi:antitoxin (DNA-binding transcriptional repressor) of toxin-antitoxin stability system
MEERIAIDEDEKLDALVDRAAQGEDIALTRNGAVVARIVATPAKRPPEQVEALMEEFRRLRKGQILGDDLTIKDLINGGRKY